MLARVPAFKTAILRRCAENNNLTSRKLRAVVPLRALADVLTADGVAAEVLNAVQHFTDAVYIAPVVTEPVLAKDLYLSWKKGQVTYNLRMLVPLVDVIKACMAANGRCLSLTKTRQLGDVTALLYPGKGRCGGGTIKTLTSFFESNILETLDEEIGGTRALLGR